MITSKKNINRIIEFSTLNKFWRSYIQTETTIQRQSLIDVQQWPQSLIPKENKKPN